MINRCPELGANYGMICFVFLKVIQLSNRLTFPPVSEPKVIKTKTENRTTMTTTGGRGTVLRRVNWLFPDKWGMICRWTYWLQDPMGTASHWRCGGGVQASRWHEKNGHGGGVVGMGGNNKVKQYKNTIPPKKKKKNKEKETKPNKQYTTFVFTIVHYCRRSPRGLWLLTGRLRHRPVPQCPAPPAHLVLWQQPVWHWCFWAAPDVG